MTKQELVGFIDNLANGPPRLLRKLFNAVRGSDLKDTQGAKEFCDNGFISLTLLQQLFENVYQLLPGETQQSAEIFTQAMHKVAKKPKK